MSYFFIHFSYFQQLVVTKVACEEQQHLVEVHKSTEQVLSGQARELLDTADVATKHVECLHQAVDKRKCVTPNLHNILSLIYSTTGLIYYLVGLTVNVCSCRSRGFGFDSPRT